MDLLSVNAVESNIDELSAGKRPPTLDSFRVQCTSAGTMGTGYAFVELTRAFSRDYWLDFSTDAISGTTLLAALYSGLAVASTAAVHSAARFAPAEARTAVRTVSVLAGNAILLGAAWEWGAYHPLALAAMAIAAIGIYACFAVNAWLRRDPERIAGAIGSGVFAGGVVLYSAHGLFAGRVENLAAVGAAAAVAWAAATALVLMALAGKHYGYSSAVLIIAMVIPWTASSRLAEPAPARTAAEGRPNLVFIVVDSLRAKSCAVYGGPAPTPALERLSERGALFERSYSLSNWTPPSMNGMIHSQYPPDLSSSAEPAAATLAYILKSRDYVTGAYLANYLVDTELMTNGFDEVRSYAHAAEPNFRDLEYLPYFEATLLRWFPELRQRRKVDTSEILSAEGEAFLNRNADRPFALWLHYMTPHTPYDPPFYFRTRFGRWPVYDPDYLAPKTAQPTLFTGLDEEDKAYIRSLYEGEVRYADRHIGRILDRLDDLGLTENTVVCITSDHGVELFERGAQGHGLTLFEGQIHVPLIIAGPGVRPQTLGEVFSAIDLMPTLAGLLNVEAPAEWAGASWADALTTADEARPGAPAFVRGLSARKDASAEEAVIDGHAKLVRTQETGTVELFDLAGDPDERENIAETDTEARDRLMALLDAWNGGGE